MKLNKTLTTLIAGAAFGLSGQVIADGTTAGVDITNSVQLNYEVNNVAQGAISSEATFRVDKKILMTLVDNSSVTTPFPGSSVTLTFRLRNDTNAEQNFLLGLNNQSTQTNIAAPSGVTFAKNADVTGTSTMNTGGIITMPADAVVDYTATFTLPTQTTDNPAQNLVEGDVLNYLATATAVQGPSDSTKVVADVNVNKNDPANLIDTFEIFAEGASLDSGAFDGVITVASDITLSSAKFEDGNGGSPSLTAQVVNDPICDTDGTLDYTKNTIHTCAATTDGGADGLAPSGYTPKAIPGALTEFTLVAENVGSQSAQNAAFTLDLSSVNGFDGTTDTGLDAFEAGSLSNVSVDYSGTDTPVISNNGNDLSVTVPNFESSATITITFTAIVE